MDFVRTLSKNKHILMNLGVEYNLRGREDRMKIPTFVDNNPVMRRLPLEVRSQKLG